VRPTGGQDRYALELARRLAAVCELDLVAMRVEGALPPKVRVRQVAPRVGPMLLRSPVFRRIASAIVARRPYDIIHTVGGALPGASVVTAQFCHAAWREVSPPSSWYQRRVLTSAIADERRAYRHQNLRAIIAVSRRTGEEIRRFYGPLPAPVTVIPNGVDSDAFAPGAPAGGRPRLLFVGAYDRKGLDVALRALALMEHPAELRAVGEGDRSRYVRLATDLGVRDRVVFEPPRDRIAEVFAAADAFVFPTRYEPFGMVIAEAMAAGLPVVTSGAAGAADLITDGVSGRIIADAEDAAAFAAALDRLLADTPACLAMGSAAREAVRGIGWDAVAEQTLAVYRAVLGRRS
jgi:glycosyltransferase involved in cell wall biosynthesis